MQIYADSLGGHLVEAVNAVFNKVSTKVSRTPISRGSTGESKALPLQFGIAEVEDQSER